MALILRAIMVLYPLVNIIIFSSLFFLAIMALAKKTNTPNGYRFLSLFFILVSFIFADEVLSNTGLYTDYFVLTIVFQPTLYAIAPAFYLAVVYLTAINKKIFPAIILHFIPYFILIALFFTIYILANTHNPPLPDNTTNGNTSQSDLIFLLFLFAQIFIYLFLSVKQLKKHKQTLPLFASSIAENDYNWLYKIIAGVSFLSIIWLAETLIGNPRLSFYFSFIYLIGTYYIGVQLVRQKDVFPFSKEQTESIGDLINEQGNISKKEIDTGASGKEDIISVDKPADISELFRTIPEKKKILSAEKTEQYKEQLLKLMEIEKPYLDNCITLPKLGKLLLLNTYQTSYLINDCFNENFYTFINRYRVDECKRMLESKQHNHLSILGIGYEAGFNSKTAFNTTFKKITGLSPKEYKERKDKEGE
jgi:AraC-like DNA-binding protein